MFLIGWLSHTGQNPLYAAIREVVQKVQTDSDPGQF
jgi:hypothetical protein